MATTLRQFFFALIIGSIACQDVWTGTYRISDSCSCSFCCPKGNATIIQDGTTLFISLPQGDCGILYQTAFISSETSTTASNDLFSMTINQDTGFVDIDICDLTAQKLPEDCNPPADSGSNNYCEAFGDPHIITFGRQFATCPFAWEAPLVDNEWFIVLATAEKVLPGEFSDAAEGATAITSVRIIYKKCNAQILTFTADNGLVNSPRQPSDPQSPHEISVSSSDLNGAPSTMITLVALRSAINIARHARLPKYLSVTITTPLSSSGYCQEGCPDTQVYKRSIEQFVALNVTTEAESACADVSEPWNRGCLFDVSVTGDNNFAAMAQLTQSQHAYLQNYQFPTVKSAGTVFPAVYSLVAIALALAM